MIGHIDDSNRTGRQGGYVVVTDSEWSYTRAVLQGGGIDCLYTVEEDGIHVYENLAEMETILWSVHVLDEVSAGIQNPEPVFSHDGAMPQRLPWRGY